MNDKSIETVTQGIRVNWHDVFMILRMCLVDVAW